MFKKEAVSNTVPKDYTVVKKIQYLKTLLPVVEIALVLGKNKEEQSKNFNTLNHHKSVISNRIIELLNVTEQDKSWMLNSIERQVADIMAYHNQCNKDINWKAWYDILPLIVKSAEDGTKKYESFKKLKVENNHNITIICISNQLFVAFSSYVDQENFESIFEKSLVWIDKFAKSRIENWLKQDSSMIEKMEFFRVWALEVKKVFVFYFNECVDENLLEKFNYSVEQTQKHFDFVEEKASSLKMI